jgi:hypothetical protein
LKTIICFEYVKPLCATYEVVRCEDRIPFHSGQVGLGDATLETEKCLAWVAGPTSIA